MESVSSPVSMVKQHVFNKLIFDQLLLETENEKRSEMKTFYGLLSSNVVGYLEKQEVLLMKALGKNYDNQLIPKCVISLKNVLKTITTQQPIFSMWQAAFLFFTLDISGISGGNIYRNGWDHVQEREPVHYQPAYYEQFGPLLNEWNSYQDQLRQEVVPINGMNWPPFILTNNAAEQHHVNHHPNPPVVYKEWTTESYPEGYKHTTESPIKTKTTTEAPETTSKKKHHGHFFFKFTTTKSPKITPITMKSDHHVHSGKDKHNHDVLVDKKNEHENAKKPLIFRWPTVKPFKHEKDDKHHEASHVNKVHEIPDKINEEVDEKMHAIKDLLDNTVETINKQAEAIYNNIGKESSKLIEKIDDKIKIIEKKLEELKTVKKVDGDYKELVDEVRSISDNQSPKPNIVHSEMGEKLRSLELLNAEAELRTDLKTSISDAVKNAQEKFNKLIDDKVYKINKKIYEITHKFDVAFEKINEALSKIPKPTFKPKPVKHEYHEYYEEKYPTPVYKPKPTTKKPHKIHASLIHKSTHKTTEAPPPAEELTEKYTSPIKWKSKTTISNTDDQTTPEYFKYTIPTPLYKEKNFEDILSRMDMNIDNLSIVDNARDDSDKSIDESVKIESSNTDGENKQQDRKSEQGVAAIEKQAKEINDDSYTDNDEIRSLDDDFEEAAIDEDEDSQLNQASQAGSFRFDELEVIQLIPVIIEQLRKGHVSESERVILEGIFGDLWPFLEAESQRDESVEINPLLRTLLQSDEVRLAKRDITKQIGNDIFKNSVRRVYRGDGKAQTKPYISLDDDRKLLSPSERLMNMVAAIVHKANVLEKSQRKIKQKRKYLRKKNKNPLGIVTVEKPRQRFMERLLSVNRMKRSLIKFSSDIADMKALLDKVNEADDAEEDEFDLEIDENDSNEYLNDYMNDDYYYDDAEYQISPIASNRLSWGKYSNDYENGSINEFIRRARQRDLLEKSDENEMFNDSYEDDDDDDYY
ncbi:CLUMA_CG016117, isoform A [Clunio marinus]|uniref:CLUMA_CG016117, isoform A n=1 Tax=Clunio marinus TaxID=568069 RepID=A0A1J1IRI3_9DIPT|nr:CLUMA_CG016117, isoform A [Clunio marinus]